MDDELDVDRRHDRVRHGRRQAGRPLGRARGDLRSRSTPTTRRSAARAATASRPRRVLFYRAEDLGLRRFFAGGGQVDVAEIGAVLQAVERGRRAARAGARCRRRPS